MTAMPFFLGSLVIHLTGAVLPFAAGRNNRLAHQLGAGCSMAGACCGLVGVFYAITGGQEYFLRHWNSSGLPFTLNLDGLAAFFLLPVFLLVLTCTLYAVRYLEFSQQGLQAARHWLCFNILVISMALVVAAADGLTFIVAWEMMALSSFLLIVSDVKNDSAGRAGGLYLIAAHLGAAFLFLLFLSGYFWTGSLNFSSFASLQAISQPAAILFFFLAVVGFGAKAGVFPLHSWLPDAHSAAPSHVSALMSGVMIKTSIYAFLRIMTFLPPLPSWCGLSVILLGLGSALFGIALASMQTDLKRSLAYSTVENIGIIFLAIGLWLYCTSTGNTAAAHLALGGALLHIWSHALFKSLLFLGAGSVLYAGGTREMSMLGGLMRRMPLTGALMITGAAAVSALPPLNGFVSELLIYLSLLHAGQAASGGQAFLFMLFVVLLALVGGMVVMTMTRIIGIVFGGEPRSSLSCKAREVPAMMIGAMALTGLLCFAFGIFPQNVLPLLAAPFSVLAPGSPPLQSMTALPFGSAWSMTALLTAGALAAMAVLRCRKNRPSLQMTWGCGFAGPGARMTYSAGSYSQFAQDEIYCSCIRPAGPAKLKPLLFPAAGTFRATLSDPVLESWFLPFFTRFAGTAHFFRGLQAGRLDIYLTYMFLTTILLLGWNSFIL